MRFHKFMGRYVKRSYVVEHYPQLYVVCWPNAGKMNALDGSGQSWGVEDGIYVAVLPDTNFWDDEEVSEPIETTKKRDVDSETTFERAKREILESQRNDPH